ncbi:hypothetical protein AAFF_G00109740 [Aldrovandia affinis]|uniref:B30.2/SPRY domain-containing protein n=1 Tax=Aldrovandia affinis TaxID=143900 RepID=A0AAD7RU34_9TELE|nr:hypothetical protein AAFF_G00109740 [Aldrovandia affinis]
MEEQPYPDHPERFEILLCREGLSKCCYWEAEWSERFGVTIAVTYNSINRKEQRSVCKLGVHKNSWSLYYSDERYYVCHNMRNTEIVSGPSYPSKRVGVYLDWSAGTLSFYGIFSEIVTHLYTFYTVFTEPLYPGFGLWSVGSLSLCQLE